MKYLYIFVLSLLSTYSYGQHQGLVVKGTSSDFYIVHHVSPGDTYEGLASRYNISVSKLFEYNNLEYYEGTVYARFLQIPLTSQNFAKSGTSKNFENCTPIYRVSSRGQKQLFGYLLPKNFKQSHFEKNTAKADITDRKVNVKQGASKLGKSYKAVDSTIAAVPVISANKTSQQTKQDGSVAFETKKSSNTSNNTGVLFCSLLIVALLALVIITVKNYSFLFAFTKEALRSDKSKISFFCILLLSSLAISCLIASTGFTGGVLVLLLIVGIPLTYATVVYPYFGICVLLICSYFISFLSRINSFPFGTVIDGLQGLLLIGFFAKQKNEKKWQVFKEPVGIAVLVWVAYNFFEVINPTADSTIAWVYTIRAMAVITLMYFIFLYNIRSVSFIRICLKIWLFLSIIAAIYGLKQEYIGFSANEKVWLSDPLVSYLLFINGHWRIFSIFSDPVDFAYNMAAGSLLCIALLTGPFVTWKKILLGCIATFFIYAMLYSGTRGAYVLLPAALILLAILKFNKKVLVISVMAGLIVAFLIMVPTSNYTLYRFQSAFKPGQDASYNVRKQNQKKIRPYILTHPIGGGLGSTGIWGAKFSPNSYLAKFPPDSGLVMVAVETGWIGLMIFCILVFIILKTGINNYFLIKDPELKSYCLAMLLIVFALHIGNFPQEAIVKLPNSILFLLAAALINSTLIIDKQNTQSKPGSTLIT